MTEAKDNSERLIEAAFAEASRRGWRGLTIPRLAKVAGLTVGEAYKVAADPQALLDVYAQSIDAQVAEELARDPSQGNWRERLFDALMLRFDAMLKDKDALRVIAIEESRDIVGLPQAAMRVRRSMARMLDAAGLSQDPLAARAASIALVPLYARVLRVWFKDEPDQAKTMAALDKALRRAERWLERIEPRKHADSEDADDTPDEEIIPSSETKH